MYRVFSCVLFIAFSAPFPAGAEERVMRESVLSETTRFLFEGNEDAAKALAEGIRLKKFAANPERTEARSYGHLLERCAGLVDLVGKGEGSDSDEWRSALAELYNLGDELGVANMELAGRFEKTGAWLRRTNQPAVFLERHEQAMAEHAARYGELSVLLARLRQGAGERKEREDCLELLAAYFIAHPPVAPKALGNDPPGGQGFVEPVEHIVDRAELDLDPNGFPVKAPPVPKSGGSPSPADLVQTVEVVFTPEITALAGELGSPLEMFKFVLNNVEFDPYAGSRRGAAETLRLKAGNDMDQASLLIALLRASGIPARYAYGMVEMTPAAAMSWVGVEDPSVAGSILTTAGLEGVTITDGSEVAAIRCRRVWVEAHLPYSNYRGAGAADGESLWVPLDPAFKQYENQFGINPLAATGFQTDSFLNAYFASLPVKTVQGKFEEVLAAGLAALSEPVDLEANLMRRAIRRQELPWLPAGIPNRLLTRDGTWSEVPADRRHGLRFFVSGQGATLDHSLSLPSVAGKQLTLSYKGATAADRNLIAASGGLFGVPQPSLVKVVPELRVDGCVVATGTGSVTLGLIQTSQISFISPAPTGGTDTISNSIIAGNYEGLAIDTGRAVVDAEERELACGESFTGSFLHRLGMRYLESNDLADRRVGAVLQAVTYKTASNAILSQQIKVAYSGGTPLTFDYAGLSVDADRAGATPFSVRGDNIIYAYGRIRGAQSSQNENLVFETNLGKEAVSTIKILNVAWALEIPLLHITPANASSMLPQLTHPAQTVNAVAAELAAGARVVIPRDPLMYFQWRGTGYIHYSPANGTGGYIISGGISGGATAEEDDEPPVCEKVTNIEITPRTPGNVYSSCSTATVEIKVTLTGYDGDCEITGTRQEIKTITPSETPPGVYNFKFGSAGDCGCAVDNVRIVIETGAVLFTDSDGRRSGGGLLEIVPKPGQGKEDISAQVLKGGESVEWEATFPLTPTSQTGSNVTFSMPEPPSPMLANLSYLFEEPRSGSIQALGLLETCGTSTRIASFPSPQLSQKLAVSLSMANDLKSDNPEGSLNQLRQLNNVLTQLRNVKEVLGGLSTLARQFNSPISPPEPDFEASFSISDQFKEIPGSNKVAYHLKFALEAEAALRKGEIRVGTGLLGIPTALAEVAIFFPYGAFVTATGSGEIEYHRPGFAKLTTEGRLTGKVVFGLGVKATAAAGFAEISLAGSTSAQLTAALMSSATASSVELWTEAQMVLGAFQVEYKTALVWGAWSSTRTWEIFDGWKFPEEPARLTLAKIDFPGG